MSSDNTSRLKIDDSVRPLTRERVARVLAAQNWSFDIDEEGDITGLWNNHTFYFSLTGTSEEILQITGYMKVDFRAKDLADARDCIEEWHRSTLWPACTYVQTAEQQFRAVTSVAVDYECGVTDAQLLQHCETALTTSMQFFDFFTEAVPPCPPA